MSYRYNPLSESTRNNPYPLYAQMRQCGPIHWNDQHKAWFVVDYEIARSIFKDPRFSSDTTAYLWNNTFPTSSRERIQPLLQLFSDWVLFMDPPNHDALRSALNPFFTAAALKPFEATIQKHVDTLLGCLDKQTDLVAHFSQPLPVAVISDVLGLPASDAAFITRGITRLSSFFDAPIKTPELVELALQALREQATYLQEKIREADQSAHRMIHDMADAALKTGVLPADRLWTLLSMLLGTATETSNSLISSGLRALLQHSQQMQQLQQHPEAIERAIDECLRYDPPAQVVLRTVKEDLTLGNQDLKAGDGVRIFMAAIHRDEQYFKDADVFTIERQPNQHLSFGAGIHHCLGRLLAKKVAAIAIQSIITRFPAMRLIDQAFTWKPAVSLRSLQYLWVDLHAR